MREGVWAEPDDQGAFTTRVVEEGRREEKTQTDLNGMLQSHGVMHSHSVGGLANPTLSEAEARRLWQRSLAHCRQPDSQRALLVAARMKNGCWKLEYVFPPRHVCVAEDIS